MTPTEAASTLRALGWRCEPPEGDVAATLAPPATEAPTEPVEGQTWVTATGTELRVLKVCDQYVTLDAGGRQIPRAEWAVWVRLFGARLTTAPQTAPALQPAPTLAPESEAPVEPSQAPRVGEVWEAARRMDRRRVVLIDANSDDELCVGYAVECDDLIRPLRLSLWHAWVRRSGAKVVA